MPGIIVVFRAHPRTADDAYLDTAMRMRDKALADYGCTEFVYSTTPDGEEVALSYWPDEASILRWKNDPEHQVGPGSQPLVHELPRAGRRHHARLRV